MKRSTVMKLKPLLAFLIHHIRPILALTILGTAFLYGVAVGKYHVFPYSVFESLNATLASLRHSPDEAATRPDLGEVKARIASVDATSLRAKLSQEILLPQEAVTVTLSGEDATASFYGIAIKGKLRRAVENASCLLVYHQGHGGNPFDFAYHESLWQGAQAADCDMLSLSMPGLGLNAGEAWYPSAGVAGREVMTLNAADATQHGNYAFFKDPAIPEVDPLALFLSGQFYLIRALAADYESVKMVGISGGGFSTTMLAALMPEIDLSIAYAGSLPKAWRVNAKHHGDWEQVYSAVWQELDYWELYLLGTLDTEGEATRAVYLIHNDADPCCFGNPDAAVFAAMMTELGLPGVTVQVTESGQHAINPDVALPVLFP